MKKRLLPNGAMSIGNDIAGVHITIEGDELTWKKAARQLRVMADLLDTTKSLHVEGFSWDFGGDYEMDVILPDSFPHGDYHDSEGNLIHVGEGDMIVNVTWANKDAEIEAVEDTHVYQWIQQHGPLKRAGSGEAEEGHHHDGE